MAIALALSKISGSSKLCVVCLYKVMTLKEHLVLTMLSVNELVSLYILRLKIYVFFIVVVISFLKICC